MNRQRDPIAESVFAAQWDAAAQAARQDHHSLVAEMADVFDPATDLEATHARAIAEAPVLAAFAAIWDVASALSRSAHEGAGA